MVFVVNLFFFDLATSREKGNIIFLLRNLDEFVLL